MLEVLPRWLLPYQRLVEVDNNNAEPCVGIDALKLTT